MMNILAFDTCLDKTYVTLYDGKNFHNKVILSHDENYHSAYLISEIISILKNNNLLPNDLNCIATDVGPGSFTGIRACVTVARMLAQQLNIKAIGVSSLEILSCINDNNNMAALDARKNKVYLFDKKVLGAIELEDADKLVTNKILVTDDKMYERFSLYTDKIVSYQQSDYPLGEILAKLALKKLEANENSDWRNLKPLYIQPPPVNKG